MTRIPVWRRVGGGEVHYWGIPARRESNPVSGWRVRWGSGFGFGWRRVAGGGGGGGGGDSGFAMLGAMFGLSGLVFEFEECCCCCGCHQMTNVVVGLMMFGVCCLFLSGLATELSYAEITNGVGNEMGEVGFRKKH